MGSPASASSSTTEPWASCRMYLIGTLVRPSSTDSCTGMSSTMLMSLTGTSPPAKPARAGSPLSGPPCSTSTVCFAASCSCRASAQPENASSTLLLSFAMLFSRPIRIRATQALLDANGIFVVVRAVLALEDRNPADRSADARLAVEFDEIAGLHGQQLFHGGVGAREFSDQ